ncbi:MAG: hypothetical protein DHS80DRAFT_21468 [Piptocephalis tieghemiana]|nr:MAG: hypothetical protein DHS80DRAFT_21468 [Piptocephalis tieghemiana]
MTFSERFCNSRHMKRLQALFCKNKDESGGGDEEATLAPPPPADDPPPAPAPVFVAAPAPAPIAAPAPAPAPVSSVASRPVAAQADASDDDDDGDSGFSPSSSSPSSSSSSSSSRRQTTFSSEDSSSPSEDEGRQAVNTGSTSSGGAVKGRVAHVEDTVSQVDDNGEGTHPRFLSTSSSPTDVSGAGTAFPGDDLVSASRPPISGFAVPSSTPVHPFPSRSSALGDNGQQAGSSGLVAGIAACATIAVVLLLGLVFLVVRRRRQRQNQNQIPTEDSDMLEKGGSAQREYRSLATGDEAQEDHSTAPPALYDRPSPTPVASTPSPPGGDLLSQMAVPVSPTAARTSLEHAPEIRASGPPPVTVTGPSEGPVDEDVFGRSIFQQNQGTRGSKEVLGPHGSSSSRSNDPGAQPVGTFDSSVGVLGDVEDFPEVPSIDPTDPRLDHQR